MYFSSIKRARLSNADARRRNSAKQPWLSWREELRLFYCSVFSLRLRLLRMTNNPLAPALLLRHVLRRHRLLLAPHPRLLVKEEPSYTNRPVQAGKPSAQTTDSLMPAGPINRDLKKQLQPFGCWRCSTCDSLILTISLRLQVRSSLSSLSSLSILFMPSQPNGVIKS